MFVKFEFSGNAEPKEWNAFNALIIPELHRNFFMGKSTNIRAKANFEIQEAQD